jgi:hypothetical protein
MKTIAGVLDTVSVMNVDYFVFWNMLLLYTLFVECSVIAVANA